MSAEYHKVDEVVAKLDSVRALFHQHKLDTCIMHGTPSEGEMEIHVFPEWLDVKKCLDNLQYLQLIGEQTRANTYVRLMTPFLICGMASVHRDEWLYDTTKDFLDKNFPEWRTSEETRSIIPVLIEWLSTELTFAWNDYGWRNVYTTLIEIGFPSLTYLENALEHSSFAVRFLSVTTLTRLVSKVTNLMDVETCSRLFDKIDKVDLGHQSHAKEDALKVLLETISVLGEQKDQLQ